MHLQSRPCLLTLPLEILREIIYLSLAPPPNIGQPDISSGLPIESVHPVRAKEYVVEVIAPHQIEMCYNSCQFNLRRYGSPEKRKLPKLSTRRTLIYWGTELMSRLLRVCRQLQREAQHVLYGMCVFTLRMDASLVHPEWNLQLEQPLSRFLRNLNGEVKLFSLKHLNLTAHIIADREFPDGTWCPGSDIMDAEIAKWKSMRSMLLAVTSITCVLYLGRVEKFIGLEPWKWEEEPTVARVMQFVSIWKDVTFVNVVVEDRRTWLQKDHAERINAECKRRVSEGEWWIPPDMEVLG